MDKNEDGRGIKKDSSRKLLEENEKDTIVVFETFHKEFKNLEEKNELKQNDNGRRAKMMERSFQGNY